MTDRHKSKVVSVSLRRIQVRQRHRDGGPERPRHRDSELIWTLVQPDGLPLFRRYAAAAALAAVPGALPRLGACALACVPRRRSERSLQRSASCRSARSHSGLGARPPDPRSSRSPTHRELSANATDRTNQTTHAQHTTRCTIAICAITAQHRSTTQNDIRIHMRHCNAATTTEPHKPGSTSATAS